MHQRKQKLEISRITQIYYSLFVLVQFVFCLSKQAMEFTNSIEKAKKQQRPYIENPAAELNSYLCFPTLPTSFQ